MYKEYHEHFSNEVYQASACYTIWKYLQNEPANDEKLNEALNETPLAWIVFRHSAMVTLIMTLGRIFDTDGEAVSIDDLIKSRINDIHLFSKQNLRVRKMQSSGAEEWIEDYIKNAYEPNAEDFLRFKPDIKKFRKIYQEYYRPLRHKLFAHRAKEYHSKTEELWSATKNANMEDMLNFFEDLNVSIREAYDNGRKPELKGRKIDEDWFSNDIQSLLKNVRNV